MTPMIGSSRPSGVQRSCSSVSPAAVATTCSRCQPDEAEQQLGLVGVGAGDARRAEGHDAIAAGPLR